jgi:glycosyltransferase involved in cell wall biosynthesis
MQHDEVRGMTIYVDHTHLGRHVTGLERITLELFSKEALAPLPIVPVTAQGTRQMIARQTLELPVKLAASDSILLCPGFPPSPLLRPFASRVLPYFHDDFLISRRADLNRRARLYMAAPFRLALRTYPQFLTNSVTTRERLRRYSRRDATITLYRPAVRNVFNVSDDIRAERAADASSLRLIALGTVEPRKNLLAAGRILIALRTQGFADATLDIVGRRGWGADWDQLAQIPGVTLHGYQTASGAAELLDKADVFICTSHDEGLGLPLLEAQYSGLPVVAPDAEVFREVLGQSGLFIDPADPIAAAAGITHLVAMDSWRQLHVQQARDNLVRWNGLAASDRDTVLDLIARMARKYKRDVTPLQNRSVATR